jgi:hypothetical protein
MNFSVTFILNGWFCAYDIVSEHTRSDILDGSVSVMLTSFYCSLGVYSQGLAYRLLVHPKILDMLRLHSKKVVKLNSAFLVGLLLSSFVAIFNVWSISNTYKYNNKFSFQDRILNETDKFVFINPCQVVEIPVEICQVRFTDIVNFACKISLRLFG